MQGQASDIAIQAEQIIYLKRMMAERIAFHTGQPVERIEADSDRDRWFTAEEAREYGFIDEVIQKDAMRGPDGRVRELPPVSLGIDEPAPAESEPERPTVIGGSTRFVPGQSHDRITVVNGKVQLGQRLKDLWRNRDLLILLTRTELKVKYKDSVLGYAWSMLNPALVLAIYYMVFKIIARTQQPHFAIWLFCGLLAWNLFNNSAWAATTVVVGKAGHREEGGIPPRAPGPVDGRRGRGSLRHPARGAGDLPGASSGPIPTARCWLLLPLALVALLVFTSALSIFLSAVNVYLRDTQHLTEVLLMAWFWGTPDRLPLRQVACQLTKATGLTWLVGLLPTRWRRSS